MGRQNERRLSLLYISATFIGVTLSAWCADRSAPIPVEFWRVGDDALSQELAVAVETAFRRSPDFRLTALGTGRTLVVWIMSNVKTEMVGKRKKATYTVRFSWMDDSTSKIPDLDKRVALAKEIGTETSFCWASALPQCVAQIVSNAKIAARKMPR
jgi:hypothetical protein